MAADVAAGLDQDAGAVLDAYLKREYAREPPIHVGMRNGEVFSNRSTPLADDIRYIAALLAGGAARPGVEPRVPVPVVTAPVQVKDVLRGIVVFPPGRGRAGSLDARFRADRIADGHGTAGGADDDCGGVPRRAGTAPPGGAAGIPAEHVPHVFERFYKADAARANASGGSGLGLSIAKAIVERHGGRIAVARQPGPTTFTIALPQDDA